MSKNQSAKNDNKARCDLKSSEPTEWPEEVSSILRNVDRLLQDNSPEKAIELLQRSKSDSPWLANANAVCQLRLGKPRAAIDIYRRVVLSGGLTLKPDTPQIFTINFAVAMLLNNSLSGYRSIIAQAQAEDHPETIKIENEIQTWKSRLSSWQRMKVALGLDAPSIELSFPPGSLK